MNGFHGMNDGRLLEALAAVLNAEFYPNAVSNQAEPRRLDLDEGPGDAVADAADSRNAATGENDPTAAEC
jgi:hypothetical protein